MTSAIGEGRNFEEAVDKAVKQLGVRIDQVDVNLVEEKRGMLFGLFGGRVKVEVTHQRPTEDKIDEILSGMMKHLEIPSQIEVERAGGDYQVNIGTVDSDGLLIGKRGETLHAIEHLVNRIVHKDPGEKGRITVDVSGYRSRRDDQLKSQAVGMAKKVKESGREMSTDPLYSPDRRVIHLALTNDSGIRTFTVGDGLCKSVVVAPADGGSSRGGGAGRGSRGGSRRGGGRSRGGRNRGGQNRRSDQGRSGGSQGRGGGGQGRGDGGHGRGDGAQTRSDGSGQGRGPRQGGGGGGEGRPRGQSRGANSSD